MYKTVISKIQEFQTVVVCLCHRSDVLFHFGVWIDGIVKICGGSEGVWVQGGGIEIPCSYEVLIRKDEIQLKKGLKDKDFCSEGKTINGTIWLKNFQCFSLSFIEYGKLLALENK